MPFSLLKFSMVPPGGWSFPTPHSVLTAMDPHELAKKLSDYRRGNSLPLGDPEADVEAYTCARSPEQCGGTGQAAPADSIRASNTGDLPGRMSMWLVEMHQRGAAADHVDAETVLERSAICEKCPAHKPAAVGCCGLSKEDAERLLILLRKGKGGTAHLGACECFGFHCSVATLLPRQKLPGAVGEIPPACWLRNPNPTQP